LKAVREANAPEEGGKILGSVHAGIFRCGLGFITLAKLGLGLLAVAG